MTKAQLRQLKTATKKLTRKKNLEGGYEDLDILAAQDYDVHEFSQYHFRVNNRLDVWPSSKKYWDCQLGKKGTYENLVEFVNQFFKPKLK